MPKYSDLPMQNRQSPFASGDGLSVRLVLNGESVSPGHTALRRGVNTDTTVTLRIGDTIPFTIFSWTYTGGAGGTCLVSVGADALAIINPDNSYLYTKTAVAEGIWSQPNGDHWPTAGAGLGVPDISATWGLAALGGGPTTTDRAVGVSRLHLGAYLYALAPYAPLRRVVGPPTFPLSTTGGLLTTKFQWASPAYYTTFTTAMTLPTGATTIRVYRDQIEAVGNDGTWAGQDVSRWGVSGLRLVQEKVGTLPDSDNGGQAMGEILTYAHTVVPFCPAVAMHGRRWLYGTGLIGYYSNPFCPETYAANTTVNLGPLTPTLAEDGDSLVQGEARFLLKPDAGNYVAYAVFRNRILALCQRGSWSVYTADGGVTYGAAEDLINLNCVSRATVCNTARGVMWLDSRGIVLWTGDGPAQRVTQNWLDLYGGDIDAGANLSTASAAYDPVRDEYIVTIPTDAKAGTCSGGTAVGGLTTVTATTAEFTRACVGRSIVIAATGTFTITQYNAPTQVVVSGNAACSSKAFTIAANQASLVVHCDRFDQNQVLVRKWELRHTDPTNAYAIAGMGWDPTTQEIIWYFSKAGAYTAQRAVADTVKDVNATTGTAFTMTVVADLCGIGGQEVLDNPTIWLVPYLASGQAAVVSARFKGLSQDNLAAGAVERTETATWAAGDYLAKPLQAGVSGKLIHLELSVTGSFDLMELQAGTAEELGGRHNG